jgi:hypothetical protein
LIEITAPANLTVKWLSETKEYITTLRGNFELSEVWPPIQDITNTKQGGLRYSNYEGK